MRYIEWFVLFIIGACGTALANLVGYGVPFIESLPGVIVLLVISMIGVGLSKLLPLNLPIAGYCSIIGLLSACPLSPIRTFVIAAAGEINFAAPFTMVGAFAGLSISDRLDTFLSQGWKILIVGILVMTGTFLGSCLFSQLLLTISGTI